MSDTYETKLAALRNDSATARPDPCAGANRHGHRARLAVRRAAPELRRIAHGLAGALEHSASSDQRLRRTRDW